MVNDLFSHADTMALDAHGNLNAAKLQRELTAAIGEDDRRRRVDDMKKRAIHTAGTYDEFRHMVSCATLSTVTRRELESLADAKKGWSRRGTGGKKAEGARRGSCAAAVGDSAAAAAASASAAGSLTDASRPAASTPMEFERDWRYRLDDAARLVYLRRTGPKRLAKLFRGEMDAALMGQLLSLLARAHLAASSDPVAGGEENAEKRAAGAEPAGCSEDHVGATSADVSAASEDGPAAPAPPLVPPQALQPLPASECLTWLRTVSGTGQFGLNVSFLSDAERGDVAALLDLLKREFAAAAAVVAAAAGDAGDAANACMKEVGALQKAFGLI
ncbi:unnamed protein product [Phaeothamnion confervicola]